MKYFTLVKLFVIGFFLLALFSIEGKSQEIFFFSEGTNSTYYDQGIVDVGNLGESLFEHTFPPGGPQWNDKVPCSTTAYKGSSSLKFNFFSSENGNWKVNIYRNEWATADISGLDSLSFYIYSENEIPKTALPLIGLKANKINNTGDSFSKLYQLSDFNKNVPPNQWSRIVFPLNSFMSDSDNSQLDFTAVKSVVFNQSETDNSYREILIDEIAVFKSIEEVPAVADFSATGYDSHAELAWTHPMPGLTYRIFASFDEGLSFDLRTETTDCYFLDFVPENMRNSSIKYRVISTIQGKESAPKESITQLADFTDDELLNMIQDYSFRYFWEGAHQATGMALERSNGNGRTVASGATGMGLMAMIVAHEREFKPQGDIKNRILNILHFLEICDRYHGAWSHWYNAETFSTTPFSEGDDGGDLVETSFVAQALIALKNYFSGTDEKSIQIREKSDELWKSIDWGWYRQYGQNVLYWHWSPNTNFDKNMKVRGWNEALITYIMAAASPTYGIPKQVYTEGWAKNGTILNPRQFYNFDINLADNWGGPLFWLHYTHLGINPHGLSDEYADYWQEHVNTAKIHYQYAVENPLNQTNYSEKCWGLTASDDPYGYTAHKPMINDNGTISPTAALATMPYTPEESLKALKYFYRERGSKLFGPYGPYDAFNDNLDWVKKAYIGIDQGPIVVMIENYRTGLLWENVMKDADVKAGLDKLGFQYQTTTSANYFKNTGEINIYPNPATKTVHISTTGFNGTNLLEINLFTFGGQQLTIKNNIFAGSDFSFDCSGLQNGIYLVQVKNADEKIYKKLIIHK